MYICSLLSPACLSIMSRPEYGCTIFDIPQYAKIINTLPLIKRIGIPGILQKIFAGVANGVLAVINLPIRFKLKKIYEYLKILEVNGKTAGEPYMKHLDDEIWEIVSKCKGRVFMYFDACHSATMYRSVASSSVTEPFIFWISSRMISAQEAFSGLTRFSSAKSAPET